MDVAGLKVTFFDSRAVTDKVPPAIRSALSKFGAYTRRRDKNSLKYRDGTAAPGAPPNVHKGRGFTRKKKVKGIEKVQAASPLRELTLFAFDPTNKSVIIGPAEFRSKQEGPGVLPALIEQRHPHTLPAFNTEKGNAAGEFKNLIR